MNELLGLPLTDLALHLCARRASPVELMEAVLAAAQAAEARIEQREARPLEGIPLGVKAWGDMARERAQLDDWCAALFEQVDFLPTPTVPYDPPPAKGSFPRETEGRRQRPAGVAAFTIPFTWSWHPAATVRTGLSRRGLPVGLQIVGPRQRDDLVLRAALAFERERPWHPHWPITWEKQHVE